ncbi:hypothetical protein ACE939_10960 [Aquimarina sp. W85]|uniref:hypothetical protein n=1 Tax=Aquimarina rhodophyticola TaxID=3342246 RepID=UPI0036706E7B
MIKTMYLTCIVWGFYFLSFSQQVTTNHFPATGNVGIGTDNPSAKLQINHTNTLAGTWNPSNSLFTISDGANSLMMDPNEIYGSGTLFFGSRYGDIARFRTISETGANDMMIIKRNGTVGIGTNTPDAKLTVKGHIHAQEVKVDLSGAVAPDYVFLKDYQLKTLDEVDNYIQVNGHLPNIPSAAIMEKEGVKLKEMNLKLLEKIEELTLYLISQDKRILHLEQQLLHLTNKP